MEGVKKVIKRKGRNGKRNKKEIHKRKYLLSRCAGLAGESGRPQQRWPHNRYQFPQYTFVRPRLMMTSFSSLRYMLRYLAGIKL